jgi:hypothetical protein
MNRKRVAIAAVILTILLLGSILLLFSPNLVEALSIPTKARFESWNTGQESGAYFLADNGHFMAQEFTVNGVGDPGIASHRYITGVKLMMYRSGSPGDIVVSIYDAAGITNVYGSAIDIGALCSVKRNCDWGNMTTSTSGAWYWFNFTDVNQFGGIPLAHNTHYYIVVTGEDVGSSDRVYWKYDAGSYWFGPYWRTIPNYPGYGIEGYTIWHGDVGGTVESKSDETDTLMFECYGFVSDFSFNPDVGTHLQENWGTDGVDDDDYNIAAAGGAQLAQSFTVGTVNNNISYYIHTAEICANDQGSGTVTVSIRNSSGTAYLPAATDWTSGTFNIDTLKSGSSYDKWAKVEFSNTVKLVAGHVYFLIIKLTGSGSLYVRYGEPGGYPPYPGQSSNYNCHLWSATGATWTPYSTDDLLFRTYGEAIDLPTLPTVSINGSASYVLSQTVTLTLSCTNALTMQFRNETSAWSVNESYGVSKAWTLSSGYGSKNVSVRFWNANGSATAYDTIAYVQYLTSIGSPSPANASTGVSLNPSMYVTLANHSVQTQLRLYMCYYGVGNYGNLWSPWVLSGNLTTNTDGIKYFNISSSLLASTKYAWFIEIENTTSHASFFPNISTFLITPGDGIEEPLGTPHYSWVFTTTAIMANITIVHPVDNSVETEALWLANHNLIFNVTNNLLNHNLSVYMTVKVRFTTGTYWETMDEVRVTPDPATRPGIAGTVTYDVSDYIPYENAEYNITLKGYDWDHYGASIDDPVLRSTVVSNANTSMNFTLVSPVTTAKNQRFAISSCDPADEYVNGVDAVSYGFRCKIAVNITNADPQFWFFICDGEDSDVLTYGSRTAADCHSIEYAFGNGMFEPRKRYMVAIGVMWSGTKPGDCVDWGTLPLSITQYDSFYDDTALFVGNFSYEWMSLDYPKTFRLFSGYGSGDTTFYGYRIMFDTYPVGESPPSTPGTGTGADNTLGSQWGRQNFGQLETNTGIAGLMIIAGLIIIALFSIIPYLIIKKKGQNVPTPVFAFFGLFGAVLSYGMGLFPLWFFILPTFLCVFLTFYKVSGWVMANKELVTAEGKK